MNTDLYSTAFDKAMAALNDDNYQEVQQNKDVIIEKWSDAQVKMVLNLNKRCLDRNFQKCSDFFKE